MTHINVLLLSGFREDESLSTTLYANGISAALRKYAPEEIDIQQYSPLLRLPAGIRNKWGMRFARYVIYPLQVPKQNKNEIIHLLDHGYTHFLYTRNRHKTIVTVTDLMPILWWKGLLPVPIKKSIPLTVLYSLYALKRATHIITISSNTKNDLVNLMGYDPSKITPIYLGVDSIFKPYEKELKCTLRKKLFGSELRKYILITGSQFYKNHETALKIIEHLLAIGIDDFTLVKTGNATSDWHNLINRYGLDKYVINLGLIPRDQLPDLYNAVDALLFPSLYEGFGWPPLEAMACGTPAVTSNVASLPEIMGSMDTMCNPYDVIGFAQKVNEVVNDKTYRQSVIQQGIIQSSKFSWENTTKKTLEIYKCIDNIT